MAERVYTAQGIVLRKYGVGEASISALILLERHGLVRVRAQSARKQSGKLRYGLEPMTFGTYSFVRGTKANRLVGIEARELLLSPQHGAARQAAGQISALLLRLMPGEVHDEGVFELVEKGLRYLGTLQAQEVSAAECAIVLSLLSKLGYLPDDPRFSEVASTPLSKESLSRVDEIRTDAVRTINRILSSSGL